MRRRTFLSVVAALAMAVSLGACGGAPAAESGQQSDQQPAAEQAATRVVTDSLGREVEIPVKLQKFMEGQKQSIPMSAAFPALKKYLLEQ